MTEGEDKPLKYPTIFNSADVAVITKVDLAAAVEFSWETAYNNIQSGRPGMRVFKVSAKTGEGMEEHLKFPGASLTELRQTAAVRQMSASITVKSVVLAQTFTDRPAATH